MTPGDIGPIARDKVFHWGYVVPNMDRALKTWARLGSKVIVPPTLDSIQRVYCALVLFESSVVIELVAPVDENSPVKRRLARGGGLDHVCLFADDLSAELALFSEKGGAIVVPPCYGEVFDRELAFVMTGMGLLVELMTRKAVGRIPTDPIGEFFVQSVAGSQDSA
jgi:methylmalonyl-CoA/ethylmalonyl-CoA epimerase